MGLFRKRGGDDDATAPAVGPGPSALDDGPLIAGPDSEWFVPNQRGVYVGGPPEYHYLRFFPTGKVYLAAQPAPVDDAQRGIPTSVRDALGSQNPDPTVGQYTGAGRFVVQRRFERPVVYTVTAADDAGFTARLTAVATATTGEYRYDLIPDPAPSEH